MVRELLQRLLLKIVDWLEPKKDEIPRKHKLAVRKVLQPHIDKRIEMGAIADPFGSCLSVLDNLNVAIDIMTTRFKIVDEQRRKIDKIQKSLNLAKRKFVIMISDRYAEETYGKELTPDDQLVTIYRIFDDLSNEDWNTSRKRNIYLEEWALDIKKEIDDAFKDLMEIANVEDLPIVPILYNSMSPDVKIKKVDLPKKPPKPKSGEDDGDEGPGFDDDHESDYPDDNMPF